MGMFSSLVGGIGGSLFGGGGGGGQPPSAPSMSQEEKDLLKKQSDLLSKLDALYGDSITSSKEQADLYKRTSGLYDVLPDGTLKLNDAAVKRQADITKAQLDRYEKALSGLLPVSEGTIQRKANDFRSLKENAARRGIIISGDTPENASSNSTSGNELIGQFNRTYGLLEDSERRGELASATNPVYGLMSASNASGPSGLIGAGQSLLGAYGSSMNPYQNQRMLEYQSALGQFGYDQQRRAGNLNAMLQGAGIGASVGGPYGAAAGAGIGLLASGGIGL